VTEGVTERVSAPASGRLVAMDSPVRAMLEPRRVAVVGASGTPDSFGHRLANQVAGSGKELDLHLVNPRYDTLLGRSCLDSLDEIDGPVDLVLLGVPDHAVEEQMALAARRGDRSAVIYGSLVEPGGGSALRDRVAEVARSAGMAVCGAGCMGFVNVTDGIRAIGYVERSPLPHGPVAFITHSGSVFSAVLRTRRHLGFTVVVSAGQELVTTAASYLDYALELPGTRVVGLLLETLREPELLQAALDRAADQNVAVVALTVGSSAAGRTMVAAHSGALAGTDGAWEALFEAHGVVRVGDLDEMGDTLELFAAGRRAPSSSLRPGAGVATVHDSGAERALLVDVAESVGVPFAAIGPDTERRLAGLLDPGLEAGNPLDVWGTGSDTEGLFTGCLSVMAADEQVAVVALAVDLVEEYDGDDSYPRAVLAATAATDKPVAVLCNLGSAIDGVAASRIRAGGVPVLEGTRTGLLALGHLLRFGSGSTGRTASLPVDEARRARWRTRLAGPALAGAESMALMAEYGIPVIPSRSVGSAGEAVSAAGELGYPVVVKTDEPAIAHRSDVAGVVLGVTDAAGVAAAYEDLARRLGPRALVAATAPDGVELTLGLVRDPHLGPLVVVGAGGLLVEVLADRVVRLPPIDGPGARGAVDRLKVSSLLDGVRGGPPADRDAVASAVVALGVLAVELGGSLDALDVNPLRCGPYGCWALDALVEVRRPDQPV
jgi:acyl-CoA synthetase (NDP forming)